MSKNTFRVLIPKNADDLVVLGNLIVKQHTADGAASPLRNLDMAGFAGLLQNADGEQQKMQQLKRDSELATENRNLLLGFEPVTRSFSSTKTGTVLFYLTSVRTVLLGNFRGNERKLGEWGYTVDGKGRVQIPSKPDDIARLAANVVAKHTADGATSLLNDLDMTNFTAKQVQAAKLQEDALRLRRDSEVPTEQRNRLLGIGKGQSSKTPNTVMHIACSVRDLLLGLNRGQEQNLAKWGFTVNRAV